MPFNHKTRMIAFTWIMVNLFLFSGCKSENRPGPEHRVVDKSSNAIETYRVAWWNLPISFGLSGNWARPMYGVVNIDNDELALRHAILEGRTLGDYRLPYWPLRSFVSISSHSAELAHQSTVHFNLNGKKETRPFRCGDPKYSGSDKKLNNRMKRIEEGFEVARSGEYDVLKATNKGSGSPVLMEHHFFIRKGSTDIPVVIKTTNQGREVINNLVVELSYTQDFNWSHFGASRSRVYQEVKARARGETSSFFAFSSGMERGVAFHRLEGAGITYKLYTALNRWQVRIKNPSIALEPGETFAFGYTISIIDKPLQKEETTGPVTYPDVEQLQFSFMKPVEIKSAPTKPGQRVSIQEMLQNIEKHKVRGLHCISAPQAKNDLQKLKERGGNLAVTGPHSEIKPNETRQIITWGHELGMEMLVAGSGYYASGLPPGFDHLFSKDVLPSEYPDSYGQDEDHSYWYGVKPTIDFEEEFGKPMSHATTEEKVIYWSRCFVDKWRRTLANVRSHDPRGDIWFYTPTPGLANIDPLDYYDQFLGEVTKLGKALTVFPFYYGKDYNQIQYMTRRWKEAGAHRVVFLPGAPTYSRPGQFIRAVSAARRGGADGACGFAFTMSVHDQFGYKSFDHDWRWKALLLASCVNFPTPELDAYSLLEDPAELVELLAVSDVTVVAGKPGKKAFCNKLEALIPGKVNLTREMPGKMAKADHLFVISGDKAIDADNKWLNFLQTQHALAHKGLVQRAGNTVILNGTDAEGTGNAEELFLQFAEMARVESLFNHTVKGNNN